MKPDKMKALIESVQEINGQYGLEKVSAVTIYDGPGGTAGTQTKVYTKPKAQSVYAALTPGLTVILKPKNSGAGWLVDSIDTNTPPAPAQPGTGQAPAPASRAGSPTPEEIGQYIDNKAGHVARAYVSLKQHFAAVGEEFTPEIFNSTISTVIISLDKHFGNDASAWGDPRPLLVAGSPEWDQTVAAIRKHGTGTVDKVIAKARVSPAEEEYLRQIEKQAGN